MIPMFRPKWWEYPVLFFKSLFGIWPVPVPKTQPLSVDHLKKK